MLQRGRLPSHLSFLFLHIIHARRLGFGTSALLGGWGAEAPVAGGPLVSTWTVRESSASSMPFMAVSVSGDVDMVTVPRIGPWACEDWMGVPQRRVASGEWQWRMRWTDGRCLVRPEWRREQGGVDTRRPWLMLSTFGRGSAWGRQLVRMTE